MIFQLIVESWDISNAFLQGLKFSELQKLSKELGIELREVRKVYLRPPANVWRHFRNIKGSTIVVADAISWMYLLLCLKPMYGFVDAPVLWQLALLLFLKSTCKGTSSCFDDNFLYWTDGHQLVMVFTLHVDDILAVGLSEWLTWARGLLEKRFGTVKRSTLPFTHNGMDYSVLPNGAILMSQNKHLEQIAAVLVPHDAKDDDALTTILQSAFR